MSPELRQLLLQVDDAQGCEFPAGIGQRVLPAGFRQRSQWRGLRREVLAIQEAIEKLLCIDLHLDDKAQDASFSFELCAPTTPMHIVGKGPEYSFFEFRIRFSNFGHLFTILLMQTTPEKYKVQSVIELVNSHGWHYVPAEELKVQYDGTNEMLRSVSNMTWFTRFFDYL